jgi:leucyl/phenylalanyl-tRNA--protein transferase
MDASEIVARYAYGLFPMDDPEARELPWWTADPRAIFELDDEALEATERRMRRSLAAAEPSWRLAISEHFEEVIGLCAKPRGGDDGIWITDRMKEIYRTLRAAGIARTFELVDRSQGELPVGDGELIAGIVSVGIGRAVMLESMCHTRPHAGNVLLARVLRLLAAADVELCDIQTLTPHTERLGAVAITCEEYERRLELALRPLE